jgi:hypothetical protein
MHMTVRHAWKSTLLSNTVEASYISYTKSYKAYSSYQPSDFRLLPVTKPRHAPAEGAAVAAYAPVKSGGLARSFETKNSLEGGAIPETGGGQIRGFAEQERDNGWVKIKEELIK